MNDLESRWLEGCRQRQLSLTLVETEDLRILQTALWLCEREAVGSLCLLGDPDQVMARASEAGLELAAHAKKLLWPDRDMASLPGDVAKELARREKERGRSTNQDSARAFGESSLNRAGYLLHKGETDGVLAGAQFTTGEVIRAAITTVGLAPGIRTVSGAFLFTGGTKVRLYADCAVVPDPNSKQLCDIACASIDTYRALVSEEPVVGFLSFSTLGSASHANVDKVSDAWGAFKKRCPNISSVGEIQFDAAVDKEVAARKCPDHPAAGDVNCFIFPNLDAGNISYKITERLAGLRAYGPILQGLQKSYSDLSRGAKAADIFVQALITMLRA